MLLQFIIDNIDFYKPFRSKIAYMSGYEMVIEKLFIYITYVVVKLKKILIKVCNLPEYKVPKHLICFLF